MDVYLYECKQWPAFQVNVAETDAMEKRLVERRGFLDGLMSIVGGKEEVAEALSDSLRSSWSIEGINLSDVDIFSSVARRLGLPFPISTTKTYYDGIADVLMDAVHNHAPMTIERILDWQGKIVEGEPGVGKAVFRHDAVYVVTGSLKNTRVIYEGPPASLVSGMMDDFVRFVNGYSFSNLVMAAIAQYYFVAIHPFEDGNGRTARMISDYLLYRGSASRQPAVFVSIEIKKRQKEYYELLDKISRGKSMDITEWVIWFLERLDDAYANAIDKIRLSFKVRSFWERAGKCGLNDRQQAFLDKVLRPDWKGALTAKKYAAMESCHPDTANRDLKKLVSCGLVRQEPGGGKNTHYSIVL